jgi:hypothetical protein
MSILPNVRTVVRRTDVVVAGGPAAAGFRGAPPGKAR